MEVQAERRVECQRLMNHRVERRDPRHFRMPRGPDPFDSDEADPVDVDHVDPHLLVQVRLPTGEHGEPLARIVAELLRPAVARPGFPLPAPAALSRRDDSALGAVARWLTYYREPVGIAAFDAMAGSVRRPEPEGALPARRFAGLEEGSSEGQVRRRRRGERAAGAVGALRRPPPAKSTHSSTVAE